MANARHSAHGGRWSCGGDVAPWHLLRHVRTASWAGRLCDLSADLDGGIMAPQVAGVTYLRPHGISGGWSSGRTVDSESISRGSNPRPPASTTANPRPNVLAAGLYVVVMPPLLARPASICRPRSRRPALRPHPGPVASRGQSASVSGSLGMSDRPRPVSPSGTSTDAADSRASAQFPSNRRLISRI